MWTFLRDLLPFVLAYLLGSIPFPVIVSRLAGGVDLREHGSGNMGARNALRVLGKKWAALIFLLDVGKGVAAAWIAQTGALAGPEGTLVGGPYPAALWAGIAAAVGHVWPVFAGFRGGKALAATAGALLLIDPVLLLTVALALFPPWLVTRNLYMAVVGAALALPWLIRWRIGPGGLLPGLVWAAVVLYAHRRDVIRWWESRRT